MDQLRDLADSRLFRACAYCGEQPNSRDHVPSKILLDEPLPTELPVVAACKSCNAGFARDEEYFACLVECALLGTTNPGQQRRRKVSHILGRSPALRGKLEAARKESDGQVVFEVETSRVRNVVMKLAKGHAMFELSWFAEQEPSSVWWSPLASLDNDQLRYFEEVRPPQLLGEIGSRASQRMKVLQVEVVGPDGIKSVLNFLVNDWIDVQEGRYRYLATDQDGSIEVRMVIGDFLACEVIWAVS